MTKFAMHHNFLDFLGKIYTTYIPCKLSAGRHFIQKKGNNFQNQWFEDMIDFHQQILFVPPHNQGY